ncbi:ribonuclease D [Conservatibacter flavescens]
MPKEIQNLPHFTIVTTDEALKRVCAQAAQKSVVALDTEFIRIRSYYPKLGLIQLYDGEQVSLIDPITITDFSPFVALLANANVTKVLHACFEDLEVFQQTFQQCPAPMYDTQLMANFLGFPNSTGFATLIQHYFHLTLDKGASRTDWLARPLSEQQLRYAAADVWYLLPLFYKMEAELSSTSWLDAAKQDSAILCQLRNQEKNAHHAYFSIPNAWKLNPEELARLHLLAKWRQEEAIRRDLALNFVVKSDSLWAVAKYAPKHTSDLLALGLHQSEVRIHGKKLLLLVEQAKRLSPESYPPKIKRLVDDPRYKFAIKQLQKGLKEVAPIGLAPEVLASKKSLENLLAWQWAEDKTTLSQPELLKGWRKEYGEKLLMKLDGRECCHTEST